MALQDSLQNIPFQHYPTSSVYPCLNQIARFLAYSRIHGLIDAHQNIFRSRLQVLEGLKALFGENNIKDRMTEDFPVPLEQVNARWYQLIFIGEENRGEKKTNSTAEWCCDLAFEKLPVKKR